MYTTLTALQDPRGRLLFFGEASSFSVLQVIRWAVEQAVGKSHFTEDNERFNTAEPLTTIASNAHLPCGLPIGEMAGKVLACYYMSTHGLLEVVDREHLQESLESACQSLTTVNYSDLCLIYLTLAIGMLSMIPSVDEAVVEPGRFYYHQAEMFYKSAKYWVDPILGFENGDLWSVQALALMAFYQVMISGWNAAYNLISMAVHWAFSLGLHRSVDKDGDNMSFIYKPRGEKLRRNIWRSLFILDRIISTSIGRPLTISPDIFSIEVADTSRLSLEKDPVPDIQTKALQTVYKSCEAIGRIYCKLHGVEEIITTETGFQLLEQSVGKTINLPPTLNPPRMKSPNLLRSEVLAILHVDLIETYSKILLTRPFFLFLFCKIPRKNSGKHPDSSYGSPGLWKLSADCVRASTRTVTLIRTAHDMKHLPPHNPLLIHFLFCATLVLLSNRFSKLHEGDEVETSSIDDAIEIFSLSPSANTHSRHLFAVVASFKAVIDEAESAVASDPTDLPIRHTTLSSPCGAEMSEDPSQSSTPTKIEDSEAARMAQLDGCDKDMDYGVKEGMELS